MPVISVVRRIVVRYLLIGALAVSASAPALAGEAFGGLYIHDVDTPLTHSGIEGGGDVQIGYRWDPLMSAKGPQPYIFAAVNSAGETHYAAAGLSFKFGDKVFIRPGLGIAIHTGSAANFTHPDHDHIDFGSRILFEPEIGVGFRISDRATLEASWVHLSHAQMLGAQNPGIDNFGARLSWKL
jgi:lipid A 3-O-deacylase